jgi:hypothetical protein
VAAAGSVATHLGGGEVRVPERNDAQRNEVAVGVAAPLLDHPVVVGVHACQAEFAVLASVNACPQKRGKVGKHSDTSVWFMSMSSTRALTS